MPAAGGRGPLALLVAAVVLGSTPGAAAFMESGVVRLTREAGVSQSGSRPCGACHSSAFALWSRHPHSHALIDPQRDPRRITARWGRRVPGWRQHVEGRFEREQVVRAFGVSGYQVYFRADPDGLRLLPACWDLEERSWRELPGELARVVRDGATWEERCAGCHTTGYRPAERLSEEPNVGCAACHGDGAEHLATEGRAAVVRPGMLEPKRAAEVCGACHSRGTDGVTGAPYAARYRPGAVLGDTFRVAQPAAEGDALFWPGGVERRAYMEYQGFLQSAHFRGGLTCISCHLPHGSQYGKALVRRSEELCARCHDGGAAQGPVHARHPAGEAGCVACHMPVINPEGDRAPVRTHTLRFLEPAQALATGMPSSCTPACHGDRDAAWAAGVVSDWRRGR